MSRLPILLLAATLASGAFASPGHARQRQAQPQTAQECMTAFQTCRSACFGSRHQGSCFGGCTSRKYQCLRSAAPAPKSH